MAGGTFDKQVGKVRPGTYINFTSAKNNAVTGAIRGTVVVPLTAPTYGPKGKFLTITADAPDREMASLGYSVYDNDPNRQMLLIREALKNAQTALVYITAEGDKATVTASPVTATAKYGGSRGNSFSFSVVKNALDGFDVSVYLEDSTVATYEGLKTVEELIAQNCDYVTFTGTGDLQAIEKTSLTGGEDATSENQDVTDFLDAIEQEQFDTLCFPLTDEDLLESCKAKIQYMRENMGRGVQAVLAGLAADYEGIINVTNGVVLDDITLTAAESCAWVAGATAAASNTESLTYKVYEGATEINGPKSHEEAVAAIQAGEFFFSYSEAGAVVAEYDINSLVTFTDGKDESYRKNRVIRVLDTFATYLRNNFPPNKYANNEIGWEIMKGIGKSILKIFEDAGAITNVDYDNDFLVDADLTGGDKTYFNVSIQPVDSSEKLFFTVSTL